MLKAVGNRLHCPSRKQDWAWLVDEHILAEAQARHFDATFRQAVM